MLGSSNAVYEFFGFCVKPSPYVAAVDLGASSGRVYLANLENSILKLDEVLRFPNRGVYLDGNLYWDLLGIYDKIVQGIGGCWSAAKNMGGELFSFAVDSWAVDYGLLDSEKRLLGNVYHHRDDRTDETFRHVTSLIPPWQLYKRNGIALKRFNTFFQLLADGMRIDSGWADKALLIPDLINFICSGEMAWEVTNASTTQLLSVDGSWDGELMERFAIPSKLFGDLISPGTILGNLRARELLHGGVDKSVKVLSAASHDTASAVLAVPSDNRDFAYISSGTWSLVGVELEDRLVTEQGLNSGFSNEIGVDRTVRFLKNIMGFWLFQEVQRELESLGHDASSEYLFASAAKLPLCRYIVDVDDPIFLSSGNMISRIRENSIDLGFGSPQTPPELVRCILDSLALAYRRAITELRNVSGVSIEVLHVVGGGSLNDDLCQRAADACGVPVLTGPVEAAAVGNALIQMRAQSILDGDRWVLRRIVASSFALVEYQPSIASAQLWIDVDQRLAAFRSKNRVDN